MIVTMTGLLILTAFMVSSLVIAGGATGVTWL